MRWLKLWCRATTASQNDPSSPRHRTDSMRISFQVHMRTCWDRPRGNQTEWPGERGRWRIDKVNFFGGKKWFKINAILKMLIVKGGGGLHQDGMKSENLNFEFSKKNHLTDNNNHSVSHNGPNWAWIWVTRWSDWNNQTKHSNQQNWHSLCNAEHHHNASVQDLIVCLDHVVCDCEYWSSSESCQWRYVERSVFDVAYKGESASTLHESTGQRSCKWKI